MSTNEKNRIRYGRCENPECSNYGLSDVMPEDGKCPFCGKPLVEDEDALIMKPHKRWPWYVLIAIVAIALIGGATYLFVAYGPKAAPVPTPVAPIAPVDGAATDVITDDALVGIDMHEEILDVKEEPSVETPVQKANNASESSNSSKKSRAVVGKLVWDYGEWSGELINNLPHGNGRLTFIVAHRIDSRDPEEREAEEGDYVIGEFYNGKLVHGTWFDKDGHQKGVIIIGK